MLRSLLAAGQAFLDRMDEKPTYVIVKKSAQDFVVTSTGEVGVHELLRRTFNDGNVDQVLRNVGPLLMQPTVSFEHFGTLEAAMAYKSQFAQNIGGELRDDLYFIDTTQFKDEVEGTWKAQRISCYPV